MPSSRLITTVCILFASFFVGFIDAWVSNPSQTSSFRSTAHLAAERRYSSSSVGSAFSNNDQDPFHGISHLIDDGNGNIRSDLATSIWNWDNEKRSKEHLPKLEYSTRTGLRLVDEIAKNLLSGTTRMDDDRTYSDLVQEGVMALMYAMAKYNPKVDEESFEHYAKRHILASLTKALAQDSRPMKLPAHVMELLKSAKRKRQALLTQTGREPTMAQVAKELDVSPQQLELYQMFESTLSVERTMEIYDPLLEQQATFADQASWQKQHGIDIDDSNTEMFQQEKEEGEDEMWVHLETVAAPLKDMIIDKDRFDNPDDLVFANQIHDDVKEFLERTLDERELQVIDLRYGLDNGGKVTSLSEIGKVLGISASRVAQIEEQAMEKLRSSYTNRKVETYLEDDERGFSEEGD